MSDQTNISCVVLQARSVEAMGEERLRFLMSEWHKHRHGDDAEVEHVRVAIGPAQALGVMDILGGCHDLLPFVADDDALVVAIGAQPLTTTP